MKFNEAMEKLESGSKVTRAKWSDGLYFMKKDNEVKAYQPKLDRYIYNEDIMLSEGWLIDEDEKEYKFSEIIPFLASGFKAKLKDWKQSYIYLDRTLMELVIHEMDIFPFCPSFEDFIANDWIEI